MAAARPNIVWIIADDMGFGDVGCYGATKIRTPSIDALAEGGIRFTDAHTPSAVCTPTRYGVLTGRYCWRSELKRGVLNGYGRPLIEPDRPTVASLLRGAGYATAAFGKWHVGLGWHLNSEDPTDIDYTQPVTGGPADLGFDESCIIPASLDFPPYCFIEGDRVVGLPDRPKNPRVDSQREGPVVDGWQDDDVDQAFCRRTVRFIESQAESAPDQPFFVYLTPSAPHRPCIPPERFRGASQAGVRGDKIVELDWIVGQVSAALKRTGQFENTLVVVTSDNGPRPGDPLPFTDPDDPTHVDVLETSDFPPEWLMAHRLHEKPNQVTYGHRSAGPWSGYKSDAWDGGHRVVFVASWPAGGQAGVECGQIVCLTDLLATAAELAGVDIPDGAGPDSVSFASLLRGQRPDRPLREATVHHSVAGSFAIRQGPWKLIEDTTSGGWTERTDIEGMDGAEGQLFNLADDPTECRNLWNEMPEKVAELLAILNRYRRQDFSVAR